MQLNKEPRQISVAEMAPHVHGFQHGENKVRKISNWLIEWINMSIKNGNIKPYDLLPSKEALAFHIGVSKGTIQNVFRYVEDCGLVESRQKIGTYISELSRNNISPKLTSKRDFAVEIIKKNIAEGKYKVGDLLPSFRKLSEITGFSTATIRMAIGNLVSQGIVEKENNIFIIKNLDFDMYNITVKTLAEKIADKMRTLINTGHFCEEKMPANKELAKKFGVSVKTIHDAIKLLAKEGILYTKRGQYGTHITRDGEKDTGYNYEHIELKLRHYISENCQTGMKLPPIATLAKSYNVSTKTVKKALDNLADEGYVTFLRGRYGGTFVTDIPQTGNEAYKWLALNPIFTADSQN